MKGARKATEALDATNVFVKYLPSEVGDAELVALFAPFGAVVSSKLMMDHASHKSLGYGFVRYSTSSGARAAIAAMNGHRIANKRLLCKLANQSSSTPSEEPQKASLLASQVVSDNLFLKPLLETTTEDDLESAFGRFGKIAESKVMIDRQTGLSRQIGFVRFEDPLQAQRAIEEMNGQPIADGAPPMEVKFADTKEQKEVRHQLRARGKFGRGGAHVESVPSAAVVYYYPTSAYMPFFSPYAVPAAFSYAPYPYPAYMAPAEVYLSSGSSVQSVGCDTGSSDSDNDEHTAFVPMAPTDVAVHNIN